MKIKLVLTLIVVAIVLCSCASNPGSDNNLSDYRPMIFVNDSLYGETGEILFEVPNGTESIGTILKTVSQNEPMVNKNYYSNNCPVGSELYYDEKSPSALYVKIGLVENERYSVYEAID